jgi:hypothetical protein
MFFTVGHWFLQTNKCTEKQNLKKKRSIDIHGFCQCFCKFLEPIPGMGQNCSNTDEVFERLTTNVCNLCNHLSGSQKYINRKALHQFSGCFYIPLGMAVADQAKKSGLQLLNIFQLRCGLALKRMRGWGFGKNLNSVLQYSCFDHAEYSTIGYYPGKIGSSSARFAIQQTRT